MGKDNLGKSPGTLWWESTYHNGLMDWLNNNAQSDVNFLVKTTWNGMRDQCVYLDSMDPPDVLVADVPQLMTIGFRIVGGAISQNVQDAILDDISQKTGVPRGVLELTVKTLSNIKNGNADDTDGDY